MKVYQQQLKKVYKCRVHGRPTKDQPCDLYERPEEASTYANNGLPCQCSKCTFCKKGVGFLDFVLCESDRGEE